MNEVKVSMEAARVNAKLTQKQLGQKIGVSSFTIRRWETGKGSPRVDQFHAFCQAVGMGVDNIILPKILR